MAHGPIDNLALALRRVPVLYHPLRLLYHAGLRAWRAAAHAAWVAYYTVNPLATKPGAYFLRYVRTTLPLERPGRVVGEDVGVKQRPDGQRDFSGYDWENFLAGQPRFENYDYLQHRVRKEDMGSAALYAFGVRSFRQAQILFPETTFADQVQTLRRHATRAPRYAADIGCGLGSLCALCLAAGLRVDAVDPSPASRKTVHDTIARFTGRDVESFGAAFRFQNDMLMAYMQRIQDAPQFPDTFFFIESIEHIPADETVAALQIMRRRGNCLCIIANAVDNHPIHPDGTGWNHITLVDNAYYARLARLARRKVLQAGSHLVLEF